MRFAVRAACHEGHRRAAVPGLVRRGARRWAAVLRRRLRWPGVAVVLVGVVPLVLARVLVGRVVDHVPWVVPAFCGGLVAGAGYFLLFASRRPASSVRKEAFRKPARIMVCGFFLLAVLAFAVALIGPGGAMPAWLLVMLVALLAGAIFFIWRGNRAFSREAAAHPGKHASAGRASSVPLRAAADGPLRSLSAGDQPGQTGTEEAGCAADPGRGS